MTSTHSLIEDVARMIEAHGCNITAKDLRETKGVIPNVPVSETDAGSEGYPGIAHDFETTRLLLSKAERILRREAGEYPTLDMEMVDLADKIVAIMDAAPQVSEASRGAGEGREVGPLPAVAASSIDDKVSDVEWLHRFLNCTPFGPSPSEIQRAHEIIEELEHELAQAMRALNAAGEAIEHLESLTASATHDTVSVPRSLAERSEAMFRSVDPEGCIAQEWKSALADRGSSNGS